MPDENRFAGLGEQLGPEDTPEPTTAEDESASSSAAAENTVSEPAFEFEDTQAKSIYVRPETLQLLEDTEFEVEAILRREHDIRNLTGREFHDALVRAVAADPEAVVDLVLDSREE